jgi:hypothetical protein
MTSIVIIKGKKMENLIELPAQPENGPHLNSSKADCIAPRIDESIRFPYRGESGSGPELEYSKLATKILMAFEGDFNEVYAGGNSAVFGKNSMFFRYGGSVYYYKPHLEDILKEDIKNVADDMCDPGVGALMQNVFDFTGTNFSTYHNITSLEDIRSIIASCPSGMLPFVRETEYFFQFSDVAGDMVTVQGFTEAEIDLYRNTFVSEYTPGYVNSRGSLYRNGNRLYNLNILGWHHRFADQFGFYVEACTDSEKSCFYAYERLTDVQKEFLLNLEKRCFGTDKLPVVVVK